MNYNKNLIDLLDEASQIQKQLIINKDANTKIIAIKANDPDVSVCYTLSAPEDYLNFTGTKLAFYDFTKFVKCFRVFDIKSKDEKLSDTPVLDGVVNANNETTDIIIKSSKTKQKISYRAARADVLTQPVFNQIKMPAVDCKFTITQEEFKHLRYMLDSVIEADTIKFTWDNDVCKITLKNMKTSNYYDVEYKLTTPANLNGVLEIQTKGLKQMPEAGYTVEVASVGLVHFTMDRNDDINMNLYISKKS